MYLEFLVVCAVISLGGSEGEDYKELHKPLPTLILHLRQNLEKALQSHTMDVSTQ